MMTHDADRWFAEDMDRPTGTTSEFEVVLELVQDVIARPHSREAQDRLNFALTSQAELWRKIVADEGDGEWIAECLRVILLELVRRIEAARV